uniref:RNA-directed RNA polymerase n=1 Tax=Sclerotimonavirus sp. TaxID=2809842 RepID=A0A9N6YJZ8_9MONO|nr:TPA_asm: RNA-dependent RNA polymerase [Sclerotimonavirus sp.]
MTSKKPEILSAQSYPEYFSRTLALRSDVVAALQESRELYNTELVAMRDWADVPELRKMIDGELSLQHSISEKTYIFFENFRYWDLVVERYRSCKRQKAFGKLPYSVHSIEYRFYDGFVMETWSDGAHIKDSNGVTLKRSPPTRRLMTYEQIQMLQDTCLARFNARLALDLHMHNGNEDLSSLFDRILCWQEKVLLRYGNSGYELVKGPESVAKAHLTSMTNGDVLPESSYDRTLEKMRNKERKLGNNSNVWLTDELSDIVRDTGTLWNCAEIFGCTKLSGHPTVYADVSAASVREEACTPAQYDIPAIIDTHCHFKRIILLRYISQHKAWPPFSEYYLPRESTQLYQLWKKEVLTLSESSFPLRDLINVEFGQFMEFDYSPDYLDLIDDKAICPGASKAAGFWFKQPEGSYRRLLEALVKTKDIDTRAIVERMRKGEFHLEERIVELTQKEREFKTAARCFCKLTLEVRLFFVITEANLKRFAGGDAGDNGYLPQQTMTMSSQKLRKRLYDMTANSTRENSCVVEIDFTRWNLRWRGASVNHIARSLEKIYGLTGVFSQAHKFFSEATVVMTDKHSLPPGVRLGVPAHKWPESDLVWRGHAGGFEGIQQTLWTIATIAMMYYATADEECSFQMAGQGDNQVFFLTFNTKTKPLESQLASFLSNMENLCGRLNHDVKPDECVDSRSILTYGKEIYANGVHILYSLKFSSRSFARLDHSMPSLSKEISGVVASSVAIAGTLKFTYRAILWKFLQVILLLRRRRQSPVYLSEKAGIDRLLKTSVSRQALLIPGSMGGFPMMPWTRYFSKGETDDLSFDAAATYYLSKHVPLVKSYSYLLRIGEFSRRDIDPTNIVNDPHSIPIDRPKDAVHFISDAIGKTLPNIVSNRDLKPLVAPGLRQNGEEYKSILTKMTPLYPEVAADMFELTPAGLYNKTVKRFSMTRTIERIAPQERVTERIVDSNSLFLRVFLDRIASSSKCVGMQHPPPYEMCQQLRDLWKLDLKNSSIGIYSPFDFKLSYNSFKQSVISATISGENLLDSAGKSQPNFGTRTSTKVTTQGYRIANCNNTIRDLKSAILMFSELQGSESVRPIVDGIVSSRSPWSTHQLCPIFPKTYGGTAVHRHAAGKHNFAMLGSCSVPTHISLSSDRAGILSGGELDYPVVFQTLFLTLSNLFQNIAASNNPLPSSLAFLIPADLQPIDTRKVEIPLPSVSIKWPKLTGNRLAWTDKIYASEIPEHPHPSVVQHIQDPPNDISLIYSYLESEVSRKVDALKVWDGIVSPTDIFDFKEITRVSPYDVEKAMCWTLLTDIFYETLHRTKVCQSPVSSTLQSVLDRRSLIYAGMWIRIRLHPNLLTEDYNSKRNIALQPGKEGYRRSVEYMATLLKKKVVEYLKSHSYSSLPHLILFQNWKSKAKNLGRRRRILQYAISGYQKISLSDMKNAILQLEPPSSLSSADPTVHFSAADISRHLRPLDIDVSPIRTFYMNVDPKAGLRMLRCREFIPRMSTQNMISVLTRTSGRVRYTIKDSYGYLPPPDSDSLVPGRDRLRVLLRRRLGKSSPLYSDWLAWSTTVPKVVRDTGGKNVHLFGVGRGATARVFTEAGRNCVGYDLRSTFPILAQRDSSYLPPEISTSPQASLFSWSEHTYRTMGNVFSGELDILHDDRSLAVVDLDLPYGEVTRFLQLLPSSCTKVVRVKGTAEEIKYFVSQWNPSIVTCLTLSLGNPVDIISVISPGSLPVTGNHDRIVWTDPKEISYSSTSDELLHQLWDIYPALAKNMEVDVTASREDYTDHLRGVISSADSGLSGLGRKVKQLYTCDADSLHGKDLRKKALILNLLT